MLHYSAHSLQGQSIYFWVGQLSYSLANLISTSLEL